MGARPAGASTFVVGDVRLTLLPDGYHRCDPLRTFVGSTPEDWQAHAELLDEQGRVVMTMGALLVELPSGERALVDLGFGPRTVVLEDDGLEFWGGRLLASLAAAGLTPDDIDLVAYSHLHLDHVGWTRPARDVPALTFGRARHVVARAEWDHWTAERRIGGPNEGDVAALGERIELLDGADVLLPGLEVVPTPGHTPGHSSFLITSGNERAVVLGDAIHCPLQITHPEWNFAADANPAAAVAVRHHLVREVEQPGTTVVGPHFPDAIFGRVLPGEVPHRVAFDVAPWPEPQALAPEAPPSSFFLPPLD